MSIVSINSNNFESEVLNADSVVLVDFWADWCGPCRMLAPILEEISDERADVKICKVNVDEESELATKYNIMSIPTIIVFKDGEIFKRVVGAQSKQAILSILD